MFDLIGVGALFEMGLNARLHIIQIRRVDARVALLDALADLMLGVAQQRPPAAGVVDLAAGHVAVPDAGSAAGDGQGHAFFACAQRSDFPLQAGVLRLAREQVGRQLGNLMQHVLLRGVQLAGLIVQQVEHAEHAAIRGQQRAGGQKTHMGRRCEQVVIAKTRVAMNIGHHEKRAGVIPGLLKALDPEGIAEGRAIAGPDLLAILGSRGHQRGEDVEVAPGQTGQAMESLIVGAIRRLDRR
jgi:hypothetical protein